MTDELNNTATASGLSAAAGYAVEWQDAAIVPNGSGWYSIALLAANHEELDDQNFWRESFGYSKAWWNSSTERWWEPDPHGKSSRDVTDRVTHWGNLPKVPKIPSHTTEA